MASSNVSSVTSHFPTANEGFTTTLSSTILSGAVTVPLNSTSGLTNGAVFVGIIEPGQAKEQTFTGIVDTGGAQITGVKWTRGTNADHTAGVTIVDYVSGTGNNMITKGLLVSHDQDGTLKDGAVDSASVLASNVVTTAKILDANVTEAKLTHRPSEYVFNHVASGCVWSGDAYGSTRVASMTAGVVYISGIRVSVSAVTSRTFTASRDTYVDVDSTGTLTYTEVTNNAASPSLASNSIRLGIIITGASNIANVGSVNQGQEDKVLPIASSIAYAVTDSLGNQICPRSSQPTLLGYRQITASLGYGTGNNQIVGLSLPVNFSASHVGRKVKISLVAGEFYNSGINLARATIWDGTVGSGTQLASADIDSYAATAGAPLYVERIITISASGLKTYNAGMLAGAGTATIVAATNAPACIKVELV